MSEESFEQVEMQIASVRAVGSPMEMRAAILGEVQRELRASRWDRRMGWAAAALLVLGVGMNVAMWFQADSLSNQRLVHDGWSEGRPSFVDTAIAVAEATDAPTARRFARQMAAMTGRKLTADEAAAIDEAVRRPAPRVTSGNRG